MSTQAGAADGPRADSSAGSAAASAGSAGRSALSEDATGFDDLMARTRTGDEIAFSMIYRQMQPTLLRYLRVLVGFDAEDVASETWAQAVRDWRRFDGTEDGFRGWLIAIGRHRALDHLRSGRRRPADSTPVEVLASRPSPHDTEAQVIARLATADAVAMIAALPRDQAEAVMLRVVVGLDAVTVAEILGKRPGAVRTAAHRGLRALSAQLQGGDRQ